MNSVTRLGPDLVEIKQFLPTSTLTNIPKKFYTFDLVKVGTNEASHPEKHLDLRYGTKDYILVGNILANLELEDLAKNPSIRMCEIITTFDKPIELSRYAQSVNGRKEGAKSLQMLTVLFINSIQTVNILTGYYTDPRQTRRRRQLQGMKRLKTRLSL